MKITRRTLTAETAEMEAELSKRRASRIRTTMAVRITRWNIAGSLAEPVE